MINTREVAKEYRLSHWAQVMRERITSGMNIRAYCKHIGICENTYFYWQRRVRAAACETLAVTAQTEPVDSPKALIPNGWTVCETVEAKAETKPITVEINGCHVHIEADTDLELLSKVCRTLRSLC